MELGADMKTKQIEDLMKEHTPNQCASLVYTVRHNLSVSFCMYTRYAYYTHTHTCMYMYIFQYMIV